MLSISSGASAAVRKMTTKVGMGGKEDDVHNRESSWSKRTLIALFLAKPLLMANIESNLKRIEEDPGTAHLFNRIEGVNSLANHAFGPLFERQVGIIKRVLEEVEKVVQDFKGMLYKTMEDPNIDLTNLENTVRLLLELEPESDPIKHYLNIQNRQIRGLLEKCTLAHDARMENLQNELREKALSDAKWRQIQQDVNQSSAVDHYLVRDSLHAEMTSEELDTLRGRYIHQLTVVLINHIPIFWKVALSVSSGKFAKSSQLFADTGSSMNRADDKVGDSLDEVTGMIHNTLSAYESKVLCTFLDL